MLILYDKNERQFLSNGIGRLDKYAFDDKVREELNGIYKLEFTYPIHAKYSKYIKHENIIRATVPDGEQPFFISRIVKKNGYLRVTAYHIFYLLIWQLIEDINIVNLSGQAALNRVLENTEFTGLSDITETNSARILRYNAVEAILDKGQDNTLISRFGGELKRDKLNVQLMNRIGRRYENYPNEIRYAKNLLSYEADIDGSNANRIMPIGFDGLLLPEKYVVKPGTDLGDYKTLKVEYSSIKAISNPESPKEGELPLEEAYEALRKAVLSDFENGRFDLKANYQIQFQELSMTEEYKNKAVLEKMYIGDEVKVIHTDEDLEILSRMIAYEWSPIRKEYDEIEMGNHIETFSDIKPTLELIAGKIEQYKTDWESNVEEITELLTTALGGHVLKRAGEILIMDTDDPETAEKIWRWNLNGLGYSSTGINGPYETAITMDGRIISKFIYTLNLSSISANLGTVTAGRIQDSSGENYWDLDSGEIKLNLTSLKINSADVATKADLADAVAQINSANPNLVSNYHEKWEQGDLNSGGPVLSENHIRTINFYPIRQGHVYYKISPLYEAKILIFDSAYNYVDSTSFSGEGTFLLNVNAYFKVVIKRLNGSEILPEAIDTAEIKIENSDTPTQFTPYWGDLTLDAIQDYFTLDVTSSKGWSVDVPNFSTVMTAKVYLYNEDITARFDAYQFTWYKQYPDGSLVSLGNGSVKSIASADIEKTVTIICNFEIYDTIYTLSTFLGDTILTLNDDEIMVIGYQ